MEWGKSVGWTASGTSHILSELFLGEVQNRTTVLGMGSPVQHSAVEHAKAVMTAPLADFVSWGFINFTWIIRRNNLSNLTHDIGKAYRGKMDEEGSNAAGS